MPFQQKFSNEELVTFLSAKGTEINSDQIKEAAAHFGVKTQSVTKRLGKHPQFTKGSRGVWNLTVAEKLEQSYQAPAAVPAVEDLVPQKDPNYVPFGNFADVKKIVQSGMFYPTFITGLSGNGKTFSVEQACAQLGRELIRVNITIETDEDDLIGGFRLVNGETVWHNGPVVEALERGAVLLLDEVDLASNKILCLQSVLEGKGVFLKKIGRYVRRAPGFNVFATANTKGKGSDDGRFIGTNVLNEAFLERFALTFEQEYPSPKIEQKILEKAASSLGVLDEKFCENLSNWSDIIRKTFRDGGIDEVISTRRLVHIIRAFAIWQDRMKAIKVCVNRFDEETKTSFIELYDKIDADVVTQEVADDQQG
ncbi:MAG: porphyrin biosynthesis protein [Synechococcus sp. ARS1019]|nr:porphyrin biosynthesis protein [Synechococcus sp. ARS1019]|tara:strand:+ start:867 stop:1967 length:1101 start_codon:yes stop_codon:yes gene_type:complete